MCPTCFVQKQTARSLTFRAESANKRQAAIDAGLCTNWKTCSNKTRRHGQMCDACYASYKEHKGYVNVADVPVSVEKIEAPVAPATTPDNHVMVCPPLPSLEEAAVKAQIQLACKETTSLAWADAEDECVPSNVV
jgi:hypothetical protein